MQFDEGRPEMGAVRLRCCQRLAWALMKESSVQARTVEKTTQHTYLDVAVIGT